MDKRTKRNDPEVGRTFQHRYKGEMYTLTVVETDDGIGYELMGTVYRSPTAAAHALVGPNQPTNGRKFWHIDD